MTNEHWDGKEERRRGVCPVHHIKCKEIDEAKAGSKSKVPIWVFSICIVILSSVLGYMNHTRQRQNDLLNEQNRKLLLTLTEHVEESNKVIANGTRVLNQLGFYQKLVMEKLNMTFKDSPDYRLKK